MAPLLPEGPASEVQLRVSLAPAPASPPLAAPELRLGGSVALSTGTSLADGTCGFCTRPCARRLVLILAGFLAIAAASWLLLEAPGMKWLGELALAVGPAVTIVAVIYRRYRRSASKLQACLTFSEAVIGTLILTSTVTPVVDRWVRDATSRDIHVPCSWGEDASDAGKAVINDLSLCAECSAKARASIIKAAECIRWRTKVAKLGVPECLTKVGRDGSVSFALAMLVVNVSSAECYDTVRRAGLVGFDPLFDGPVSSIPRSLTWPSFEIRAPASRPGIRPARPPYTRRVAVDSASDLAGAYVALGLDTLRGPAAITVSFKLRRGTVWRPWVFHYLRAAFIEEALKYFVVRLLLFKDRVVDCGGLLVYAVAAGAGFAALENTEYVMVHGLHAGLVRMFLTVPMHCCTALIIGIHMGYKKFLGWPLAPTLWLRALLIPILIHGSFNITAMYAVRAGRSHASWDTLRSGVVGLFAMSVVNCAGIAYCRCSWRPLRTVCVVDVRALLGAWVVSAPRLVCFEPESLWLAFRGSPCQTAPCDCPGCGASVLAHVQYPSLCPFCGTGMPGGPGEHATCETSLPAAC